MTRVRRIALALVLTAAAGPSIVAQTPATAPSAAPSAAPTPLGPKEQALLAAIAKADAAQVKTLLEQGASVAARVPETGRTPLHLAAETGQLAIVELLLVHRADVQARDTEFRETPVGVASRNNRAAVVRALLARNAGPDAVPTAALNAVYQDSPEVMHVVMGTRALTGEDLALALELARRRGAQKVAAALEGVGVAAPVPAAGIAPAILESYAGRYADPSRASAIVFSAKDGVLSVTGLTPGTVALAPLAIRTFTSTSGPLAFRVRFNAPDADGRRGVVVRRIGSESTYVREAVAPPPTPPAPPAPSAKKPVKKKP